ncbi:MAG: hypothetical protein RIM72_05310 [Alphaproteobacteria bacterium]
MIELPNVVRLERELEWGPDGWAHILVIVTNLSMDPQSPDHDPTALHAMTDAVSTAMREIGQGYHRIVIRHAN